MGHSSAAAFALPVELGAVGHLRRVDSSACSSALTMPLYQEAAIGVQHNCSYMLAGCCAPVAADSTTAAAARRSDRVERIDASDAVAATAALAAALAAARDGHSRRDELLLLLMLAPPRPYPQIAPAPVRHACHSLVWQRPAEAWMTALSYTRYPKIRKRLSPSSSRRGEQDLKEGAQDLEVVSDLMPSADFAARQGASEDPQSRDALRRARSVNRADFSAEGGGRGACSLGAPSRLVRTQQPRSHSTTLTIDADERERARATLVPSRLSNVSSGRTRKTDIFLDVPRTTATWTAHYDSATLLLA
jgi:hypothetical protein|tara:strand:- start:330 stop:1244 length:915 start_codon:yes stop_codon:yes gene_type:complete